MFGVEGFGGFSAYPAIAVWLPDSLQKMLQCPPQPINPFVITAQAQLALLWPKPRCSTDQIAIKHTIHLQSWADPARESAGTSHEVLIRLHRVYDRIQNWNPPLRSQQVNQGNVVQDMLHSSATSPLSGCIQPLWLSMEKAELRARATSAAFATSASPRRSPKCVYMCIYIYMRIYTYIYICVPIYIYYFLGTSQ